MTVFNFFFSNRTLRQTVLKNTFWLTVSEVAGRAIRGIIVIYAARVLGVQGYGLFSYSLGFVGLFTVFGDIGVESLVAREVAKGEIERRRVIASGFFIKLLLSALSYAVIVLAAVAITPIPESKILIPFLGLAVIFDSLRQFNLAVVNALERMEIQAGIMIVNQGAAVALGLAALWWWGTPLALALAYAAASLIGFFLAFFYLRSFFKDSYRFVDRLVIKKILIDSIPFALLSLVGIGLANIDLVMLGWLKTITDVGYYGAALKPIQLIFVIPMLISWSLLPLFSRRAASGDDRLIIEKGLAAVFLIAFPITFGGFFMADFIIGLLYGATYAPAIAIFRISVFNILLNYPVTVLNYALLARNQQKQTVVFAIASSLTNIILNYFFILRWGMRGAAVATILAQLITTAGIYWVTYHQERFSILSNLTVIMKATALMSAVIIGLRWLAIPNGAVFAAAVAVYCVGLWRLGEPLLNDIRQAVHAR